jgi:antitoxin component YwqK of YwqJK toxin-antitoxin module
LLLGGYGFGQSEIDTARYKSYENGVYRIMQIQVTDLELNPMEYSFTYYYTSDGTSMCKTTKCGKISSPGVLKTERFKEHLKDGEEREFYRCDVIEYPYKCPGKFRLKSKGKWRYGKKIGKWKTYHKNGKLESVISFKNGKRNGKYKCYYIDGRIISTAKYKNGVLIEDTEYLLSPIQKN